MKSSRCNYSNAVRETVTLSDYRKSAKSLCKTGLRLCRNRVLQGALLFSSIFSWASKRKWTRWDVAENNEIQVSWLESLYRFT